MACCELSMSPFLKRIWARVFQQSPFVGLSLIFIRTNVHSYAKTLQLSFSKLAKDRESCLLGKIIQPFLSFCHHLIIDMFTNFLLQLIDFFEKTVHLSSALVSFVRIAVILPFLIEFVDIFFNCLHSCCLNYKSNNAQLLLRNHSSTLVWAETSYNHR